MRLIIIVLYTGDLYMRKFVLGLAIALAACNIASGKEYITLESSAGNTIVDENGGWILGPYDNLHVDYMDGYDKTYVYGSFYENGQKRYVNLVELAYFPAGYEYAFSYNYVKALTGDGFKLVNSNGTYAINDVVNQYSSVNKNLILGRKGDYWYLYNQKNGNQILTNPIKDSWKNIDFLESKKDQKLLFIIHTFDGYTKYVTEDVVVLTENEANHLINTDDYKELIGNGAGTAGYSEERLYSRKPSDTYELFSQVDKKGNTLYGMRIGENEIVIPANYKSIQHLGNEFNYFVVSNENNKYGIINSLNQIVVHMNYDSYEQLSDRSFVLKDSNGSHIFNAEYGVLFDEVYDSIDTTKPIYVLNKVTTATYDKTKYVIDTNLGYKLFKLPYFDDDITSFYKDLFVYKSDGKYGLMDYKGRIIIEPKFDKVTINEPELARYIKRIESL